VQPLVSVLIPCYNAEAFLVECLNSALSQTYSKIEIIVEEDGSTDGSLNLANSFEPRGIRVIGQTNQGQSAALTSGFTAWKTPVKCFSLFGKKTTGLEISRHPTQAQKSLKARIEHRVRGFE
jgi:glycosyltransferase involved in cell wall biosynthesis